MSDLRAAAEQFAGEASVIDVEEYGNGNINDTFLVSLDSDVARHFVLQRINRNVFRDPALVQSNIRIFTEHARTRLRRTALPAGHRWEVPRLLPARDGRDYWIDPEGSFWRAMSFIDGAQSFETIRDVAHAREVGYALGMFQRLISDLPSDRLADTLEGFHVAPRYLQHYDAVLARHRVPRSPEMDYCLHVVNEQRAAARVLEDARAEGKLVLRPIHGDPKVNNVMIDTTTRRAVSIVDLDTIKPGLIHYDVGDCLRSCCNPLGEETEQWEEVRFEPDLCRAILHSYLSLANDFLTPADHQFLYDATRLIPFELGLRFFTDYLEGNVYFKVKHSEHNLARALVQFRLAESIESQESPIRWMIAEMT